MRDDDTSRILRRTMLTATGSALALSSTGAAQTTENNTVDWFSDRCPEATTEPSMGHCDGASMEGCTDDHPETEALREAVAETLEEEYPDANALLEAGFKPYFDTISTDDDGWSHWLSPEHISDDSVMDPERPESVLVDNDSWRSIGVMFIATSDGEAIDPPPAVYEVDSEGEEDDFDDGHHHDDGGGHHHDDEDRHHDDENGHHEGDGGDHHHEDDDHYGDDHDDGHHDGDDHREEDDHENGDHHHDHAGDENRCAPWHYHAGLPGRFAWWFYQQVYEGDSSDRSLQLPCRTPCMMHVWTVDHPEGVYAHDAPPAEYRERDSPAENGFDTDAQPGEDRLEWDALPESELPDVMPDELREWIDW
ncbi:hypothetical protein [Halostagnicola bangensis]